MSLQVQSKDVPLLQVALSFKQYKQAPSKSGDALKQGR